MSAHAVRIRSLIKQALLETLTALDRAQSDADVETIKGIVENYDFRNLTAVTPPSPGMSQLIGVGATLDSATARLERLRKPR